VMWASKVVIMDEPTAALGVAQAGMVLNLVRRVRQTGIPVVFISHNMPQVFEVADRVVVLRLGEVVAELDPEKASTDEAVAAMTGSLREEESDALIVKSYAVACPTTRSTVSISDGSAAADESKTR
jgi:ABC-type sugar transport system ATPase subunit